MRYMYFFKREQVDLFPLTLSMCHGGLKLSREKGNLLIASTRPAET